MDPKELKRKLLEHLETRRLLPAAIWGKELAGKLRQWPGSCSPGGEREQMEISQKTTRVCEDL